MRTVIVLLLAIAFATRAPILAAAEPTEITVRVLSKDAKFVGSTMGGMRVTLRDAHTGEVLASGVTRGGTGDTRLLMHDGGGRRARLADDSAAKFAATLELDAPRLIEVEAYGPLAQPQAAHRVLASQWVVPGRGLSAGDGWVLELPGLVVDVLAPPAPTVLPGGATAVEVRANVTTMCGCPVEPKGLWDADALEIRAVVSRDGRTLARVPLAYAGATSQFAASVPLDGPGTYELLVYAYDPANGNTGLDRTTVTVPRR
jgi:hypothetical protein